MTGQSRNKKHAGQFALREPIEKTIRGKKIEASAIRKPTKGVHHFSSRTKSSALEIYSEVSAKKQCKRMLTLLDWQS